MMNFFEFNGKQSRDFGIYISGSGTFNSPERDVSKVSIPGRNGDLLIDNGRFKNISVEYPAFIRTKFKEFSGAAREWLLSHNGYFRLEDTYHPEEFRLASFSGPIDFDVRALNMSGEFELLFDCKPQRFLKSGEQKITANGNIQITNPTSFAAKPIIRVYGTSGNLIVGDTIVQLKKIAGYVDIDCDTENAFKEITNCNSDIFAPDFPTLPPGQTGVSTEGAITSIEIIPRWWTV